ncbi:phosphatidylinositol-specific phospholipase C/glycerophosphodiester phosphodiesterase family protein [Paenibacillus sp. MBLB4367]|uniref:phosphatidylinositol-specific phospholipase C/glycerophosphodiester phosphodiesterase family protein n=1 Tax=Paenibacillus sp. MBLB4367 TaxID=3384767 RepID=UPI0039083A0E
MDFRRYSILALLACIGLAWAFPVHADSSPEWTGYRMIAHAMGGINGHDYTNSYEAFLVNYEKGHRVFEVDLILTEDGKLAARHDWLAYTADLLQPELPEEKKGVSLTLRDFKGTPILEKYKALSFKDIVKMMQQYPDIYLVTDTKETDPVLVTEQFRLIKEGAEAVDPAILNRIIPELYTEDMVKTVMDIYPFPNKLYSLYQSSDPDEEILRFVRENGIQTVAMPVERAQMMPELMQGLNDLAVKTYVHSVNSEEEIRAMTALGVYGVYTDFLGNEQERFFADGAAPAIAGVQQTAATIMPRAETSHAAEAAKSRWGTLETIAVSGASGFLIAMVTLRFALGKRSRYSR